MKTLNKGNSNLAVIGLAALVALVVALGVIYFVKPTATTIVEEIKEQVGAVVGPDFYGPYFGINDAKLLGYSKSFYTASSTICSFKLPSATSTLISATVSLSTGSTSALQLGWGYDVASYAATTSGLGVGTFPASTLGSIVASSTDISTSLDDRIVLPPNGYLNLKFGGACTNGVTCTSLAGSCKALLLQQ